MNRAGTSSASRKGAPRSQGRAPGARRHGARRSPKKRVPPSRTGRKWLQGLGVLLILAFASLGALFFWSTAEQGGPDAGEVVRLDVEVTDSVAVIAQLHHAGLVESPRIFAVYWYLLGFSAEVSPRLHLLPKGASPRELLRRLTEKGARAYTRLTLVEGWNRWDIAKKLDQEGVCDSRAFLRAVADPSLLHELELAGDSAEGFLFPATYEFYLDENPRTVVRRLVKETRKRLQRAAAGATLPHDVAGLAYTERQFVTLASVVEKETGRKAERARIARVFYNRMLQPTVTLGRLQSDPTAAYGCRLLGSVLSSCGDDPGRVTAKMQKDASNPYNTYKMAGLPPGPICNPGEASFEAVFNPVESDEFFFVADGQGGHRFSSSYDDHRAAVQQLRQLRGVSTE